jgi:hypothetical protein
VSHHSLRLLLTALIAAAIFVLLSTQTAPAQPQGDFVTVQGNQFIFWGEPIKLKGTNFYPKDQA